MKALVHIIHGLGNARCIPLEVVGVLLLVVVGQALHVLSLNRLTRRVVHRQQLRRTRRVQHGGYLANLTDDRLKRILLILALLELLRPLVLGQQVETRASQAEVVVAGQNEDVVWKLVALGAADRLLILLDVLLLYGIHIVRVICISLSFR